jgi:hypothetical protein
MYKNAFLSEFSFSDADDINRIIKCHLLSNKTIVVPAGTALSSRVGHILAENLKALGSGAIILAHGSDCSDLAAYIEKYPNPLWVGVLREVFEHFDKSGFRVMYQTSATITQFNRLMRDSASGQNSSFMCRPGCSDFCEAILGEQFEFNLPRYMELVDLYLPDRGNNAALKAYARYAYNYFGSSSTGAGNTFSLENTAGFNHVCADYEVASAKSGIELLISVAMDLTSGIEDLTFIAELDEAFLDKLTYSDIFEIRESWLHREVLSKYDELVQACTASYLDLHRNDIVSAMRYLEIAFEIREQIVGTVKLTMISEVRAYKFHRIARFLADTSIKYMAYFSGVELVRTLADTFRSAVTEVAVMVNRETQMKRMITARTNKMRFAASEARLLLNPSSPVIECLRMINCRTK